MEQHVLSRCDQARGGTLYALVAEPSGRKMELARANVHATLDVLRRHEVSDNAATLIRSSIFVGEWTTTSTDCSPSVFGLFEAAHTHTRVATRSHTTR